MSVEEKSRLFGFFLFAAKAFPTKIIWTDESTFHINGAVNRHNCKYWRDFFRDIPHLKEVVTREINELRQDTILLQRVCNSVTAIVQKCIDADGGHFEKYR